MRDNPGRGRGKRGYYFRIYGGIRCYQKMRLYCSECSIKNRVPTVMDLPEGVQS